MLNRKEIIDLVKSLEMEFQNLESQVQSQKLIQNETNAEMQAIRHKIEELKTLLKIEIAHERGGNQVEQTNA